MAKEIGLQELIEQVRAELFTPLKEGGPEEAKFERYPLFFVDQVEVEVSVNLTYDAKAGIKITIPLFEGAAEGGRGKETGNRIKITLSPILSHEEQRGLLVSEGLLDGTRKASGKALRKGGPLAGEEE